MSTDNQGVPLNFNKLQLLILEKQKIEREITAGRVINLRRIRKTITNNHILAMVDKIERMISQVNYVQVELDTLLGRVEDALDIDPARD